jgi:hypothetical protein
VVRNALIAIPAPSFGRRFVVIKHHYVLATVKQRLDLLRTVAEVYNVDVLSTDLRQWLIVVDRNELSAMEVIEMFEMQVHNVCS